MRVASAIPAIVIALLIIQAPANSDEVSSANAAPEVPKADLSDIPGSDWAAIKAVNNVADSKERQKAFVNLMLPIIRKVNGEVLRDRKTILAIVKKLETVRRLTDAEIADLKRIAAEFDVEPTDLPELLRRADAVPEGLAISQAALESGWGSSDLAKNGLNFFGETRSYGGYAWFESIEDCVRAYVLNLDTHRAYERFREMRENDDDGKVDSFAIAIHLTKYSELGREYIDRVRKVMRATNQVVLAKLGN